MKAIPLRNHSRMYHASITLVAAFTLNIAYAHGVDDPRDENEADYQQRLSRARYLAPHLMSEGIAEKARFKTALASLQAEGVPAEETARLLTTGPEPAFPFKAFPELPSIGTVRTLTILVDFADFRAEPSLPIAGDIAKNIYGEGTEDAQQDFPFESVHKYYQRASEGLVNLQGNVLDWHHFTGKRMDYQPKRAPAGPSQDRQQQELDNRAIFRIAREALANADANHDFSQYDNDYDGDIDCLTILYAGPKGSWASFWWAYRWQFFIREAMETRFDGKRLNQFVFQFVETRPGTRDLNPRTLIHETGHAFGLADYYDYDSKKGPPGGVGGLDMMDANIGNHCAFSRWLLDWIKPEIISTGSPVDRTLVPSGSPGISGCKAIAIFPELTAGAAPVGEMFIIENRQQIGNDANAPGSGMLIWQIDANLDSSGESFRSDNSYTSNKLIRLVRADSANDFLNQERASSASYFRPGSRLEPDSNPSSIRIDGSASEVRIFDIREADGSLTAKIGIGNETATHGEDLTNLRSAVQETLHPELNFSQIESLDRQLSTASPKEIETLWASDEIQSLPVSEGKIVRSLILSRWASKAGEPAAKALLDLQDPLQVKDLFPRLMNAWANNDPGGASRWYFAEEQQSLRESALVAGSAFTERIFSRYGFENMNEAIDKLDMLHNIGELGGAMRGLREAKETSNSGAPSLDEAFLKLKKNRVVAEKIIELDKAMEKLNVESIGDPSRIKEFQEFLKEGLPTK